MGFILWKGSNMPTLYPGLGMHFIGTTPPAIAIAITIPIPMPLGIKLVFIATAKKRAARY